MFSGIGLIGFCCISAAAAAGLLLSGRLPEDCRSEDTQDAVKTTMNVLAILSALVLGLLVAGAKTNFDTRNKEIEQFSTSLTVLDRELVHFGQDAKGLRDLLHAYTARKLALTWPADRRSGILRHDAQSVEMLDDLEEHLRASMPQTDADRARQTSALQLAGDLKRTSRLLMIQQSERVPRPFLVVVIFWLSMLFLSFALFAPRNRVVIAAMLICAVSVSAAVNLIYDMDQPFAGFISVSSMPLRQALDEMKP